MDVRVAAATPVWRRVAKGEEGYRRGDGGGGGDWRGGS
jgi:hypothetical protein